MKSDSFKSRSMIEANDFFSDDRVDADRLRCFAALHCVGTPIDKAYALIEAMSKRYLDPRTKEWDYQFSESISEQWFDIIQEFCTGDVVDEAKVDRPKMGFDHNDIEDLWKEVRRSTVSDHPKNMASKIAKEVPWLLEP